MKLFLTAISFLVLGFSTVSFADQANEGFKLIHVADLQASLTSNPSAVHIYDANNNTTRKTEGLIPGAVVLASSSQYDTQKVLPTDKAASLVFYCANTECMASHSAAKRAVGAGYKNVSVMADGIEGWKKAGMKTQPM